MNDIRWVQRFDNYERAYNRLQEAIKLSEEKELSLLEKQGLIQAFEFTQELSWKLLKDYLEYQGYQNIRGSHDAFRESYRVGLIDDIKMWLNTIEALNYTTHAYDEDILEESYRIIIDDFATLFEDLLKTFIKLKEQEGF